MNLDVDGAPHTADATKIGKSSLEAMLAELMGRPCPGAWNHWLFQKAPQPQEPEELENRWMFACGVLPWRRMDMSFLHEPKATHHSVLTWHSALSLTRKCFWMWLVCASKLYSHCRKLLPKRTTLLACWSRLTRDSSPPFRPDLHLCQSVRRAQSFSSFSMRRQGVITVISTSMLRIVRRIKGPFV